MTIPVLLIGMPASGKTTYIGALSHLLTSGRADTALRLAGLTTTEAHASSLEERWLACQVVDRTNQRSRREGSYRVRLEGGGPEAELVVPDLSGEAFRRLAARGEGLQGLFETLVIAGGLVLFTNANRPQDDRMIFDVAPIYQALDDAFAAELERAGISPPEPRASSADGVPPGRGKPFDPDAMPEEVLLVELLQLLNRPPSTPQQRGLAIVISAWDVVETGETPEEWLSRARPMISQFLKHNHELWDVGIWAVSALGGDLPSDAERLLAMTEPAERIRVVGPGAGPRDLSAPISWLLGRASDRSE